MKRPDFNAMTQGNRMLQSQGVDSSKFDSARIIAAMKEHQKAAEELGFDVQPQPSRRKSKSSRWIALHDKAGGSATHSAHPTYYHRETGKNRGPRGRRS
jgi:hypothetical protein